MIDCRSLLSKTVNVIKEYSIIYATSHFETFLIDIQRLSPR